MQKNLNYDFSSVKEKIVAGRWIRPIEGFVPIPEQTDPIKYCRIDNYEEEIQNLNSQNAILAHETTQEKARGIIKEGFNPTNKEMCSLRDRAVFGWISPKDIGYFRDECGEECDTVVFFEVPKRRVYVSSYRSSAYLLGMGKIDPSQYEKDYVLKLSELESIIRTSPVVMNNIGYPSENFLINSI